MSVFPTGMVRTALCAALRQSAVLVFQADAEASEDEARKS